MSIIPILLTLGPIAIISSYVMSSTRSSFIKKIHRTPKRLRTSYFLGLNYLINNEPDKAVDVFVKLLEVDSDTVETHLALGALFRRKGEVNRAIRIHQNLIARPQLDQEYRNQALSALGEDYLRAGVFDRAESIFLELIDSRCINARELRFLLHIYQQEKDWSKAINIAQKLALVEKKSQHTLIAHYYCELYEDSKAHALEETEAYLQKALSIDCHNIRALILKGHYFFQKTSMTLLLTNLRKLLERIMSLYLR